MIRAGILATCATAISIIAFKIGYECGRYHRSPEDMLEAAVLRVYEPIWQRAEPTKAGVGR